MDIRERVARNRLESRIKREAAKLEAVADKPTSPENIHHNGVTEGLSLAYRIMEAVWLLPLKQLAREAAVLRKGEPNPLKRLMEEGPALFEGVSDEEIDSALAEID